MTFIREKGGKRTDTMNLSRHRMEVQVCIYDEEDYSQYAKVYAGFVRLGQDQFCIVGPFFALIIAA
jgi:hypothetical protein